MHMVDKMLVRQGIGQKPGSLGKKFQVMTGNVLRNLMFYKRNKEARIEISFRDLFLLLLWGLLSVLRPSFWLVCSFVSAFVF